MATLITYEELEQTYSNIPLEFRIEMDLIRNDKFSDLLDKEIIRAYDEELEHA